MSDDDKSLIKDILKSPGWPLIQKIIDKSILDFRQLATGREGTMEDRLWYSAMALSRETLLNEIKEVLNK